MSRKIKKFCLNVSYYPRICFKKLRNVKKTRNPSLILGTVPNLSQETEECQEEPRNSALILGSTPNLLQETKKCQHKQRNRSFISGSTPESARRNRRISIRTKVKTSHKVGRDFNPIPFKSEVQELFTHPWQLFQSWQKQ
jgi:hypothetical protein